MKKLYLVRHAKSSWANEEMDDFNRPLNVRGENDAPHMAKILKQRSVVPNKMISSPAIRALSTCKEFAKVLSFDEHKIVTIEKLYHAGADTWLKVLRSLEEHSGNEDVAVVFGHNPGITDFANQLLNVFIDNIPTCGIVSAVLNIDQWKNITLGCGKMDAFDYPKNS